MRREFTVVIEQDDEGLYVSKVTELRNCFAYAKSIDELIKRTREMILVSLEEQKDYRAKSFVGVQRVTVTEDRL